MEVKQHRPETCRASFIEVGVARLSSAGCGVGAAVSHRSAAAAATAESRTAPITLAAVIVSVAPWRRNRVVVERSIVDLNPVSLDIQLAVVAHVGLLLRQQGP